ncbi:T3SS effector HopA1 family protein [Sorangium sp. So ce128]|uniref:T3SS effector HopA1 family protein n=1 Tax=Sorangium sp. So ce128 TaxID=3133281 RepID=UPI003F608DFC
MTRTAANNPYLRVFGRMAAELRVSGDGDFVHVPVAQPDVEDHPDHGLPALSPDARAPAVPAGFAHFIYGHFYLRDPREAANARSNEISKVPIRAREDEALGLSLRSANRGKGYADGGWEIVGRHEEEWLARKAGITLLVRESDLAGDVPPGAPPVVSIRFPHHRPYMYPGFYTAVGDRGPAAPEAGKPLLRIYINVDPQAAPPLVELLTAALSPSLSQFSLKVLNNPRFYPRPDAAVAYVLREDYGRVKPVLEGMVRAFRAHLNAETPSLTRPLAPGIAVAEEPATDGVFRPSFGQHRCTLVARGLTRAFADAVESAEGRRRYILRELEHGGVNPMSPYLNPGSSDDFAPLDIV